MKTKQRDCIAEFHADSSGLKLFSVWVADEEDYIKGYDVEFSEAYGYIFHCSSGGIFPDEIDGIYWASAGVRVKEVVSKFADRYVKQANRTRRLQRLPRAMRKYPDPLAYLQSHGIESESVYCTVCADYFPDDEHCRHVYWTDCGWRGAGAFEDGSKESFLALVRAMPEGFASDLAAAIKSERGFSTFTVSSMIGGGGLISLYGTGKRESEYGQAMAELGSGDRAEELSEGWGWLQSLYRHDTVAANATTLEWLESANECILANK